MGRRVVLLDADLGLANIDILLGLTPRYTLADVIEGRCELSEVLLPGPGGIRVAPASSGLQSMIHLEPAQYRALIQSFSDIGDKLDVLVIDTAAGIGGSVVNFIRAAQEVMVVVCDEPTSISGAYGLIKLLNLNYGMHRFSRAGQHDEQPGGRSQSVCQAGKKLPICSLMSRCSTSARCRTTNVRTRPRRRGVQWLKPFPAPNALKPSRPLLTTSIPGLCRLIREGMWSSSLSNLCRIRAGEPARCLKTRE